VPNGPPVGAGRPSGHCGYVFVLVSGWRWTPHLDERRTTMATDKPSPKPDAPEDVETKDLDNVSGGFQPIDGAPKPFLPVDG